MELINICFTKYFEEFSLKYDFKNQIYFASFHREMFPTILWIVGFCVTNVCQKQHINTTLSENKWNTYRERPDDPLLSCYMKDDGTWRCIERFSMDSVDPDDSY